MSMTKLPELDRLLETLEGRIDEKKCERTRALHRKAMSFEPVEHLPLSFYYKKGSFPGETGGYPYRHAFDDPEKMLYNELTYSFGSILNSMEVSDDFLYQIRANFGVVQLASLFGGKVDVNDSCSWVDALPTAQVEQKLQDRSIQVYSALCKRSLDTMEYYAERLKEYPLCNRTIAITQPDFQGPFDVAHLVMGEELFYRLYDDPEWVHDYMGYITELYIDYVKRANAIGTGSCGGDCQIVHGAMIAGNVFIKEDTATAMLSGDFYEEFIVPYNKQVFEAVGGGSLHYCGKNLSWHDQKIPLTQLRAVNFGQPSLHDYRHVKETYLDRGIAVFAWGVDGNEALLQPVYDYGTKTGIGLLCMADSADDAKRIYEAHLRAF